jgi:hypothetical protein
LKDPVSGAGLVDISGKRTSASDVPVSKLPITIVIYLTKLILEVD